MKKPIRFQLASTLRLAHFMALPLKTNLTNFTLLSEELENPLQGHYCSVSICSDRHTDKLFLSIPREQPISTRINLKNDVTALLESSPINVLESASRDRLLIEIEIVSDVTLLKHSLFLCQTKHHL